MGVKQLGSSVPKAYVMATVGALSAWQIYVVFAGWRDAAHLESLIAGLGVRPPLMTRLYIQLSPIAFLFPLISAAFLLDLRRRANISVGYGLTVFLVVFALTAGFQSLYVEGHIAPFMMIIENLG